MKPTAVDKARIESTNLKTEKFWNVPVGRESGLELPLQIVKIGRSEWTAGKSTIRRDYVSLGLELVIAGDARFTSGGAPQQIRPGELFIKRPGQGHRYETGSSGFLSKLFVNFRGTDLHGTLVSLGLEHHSSVSLSRPERFAALHEEAIEIIQTREAGWDLDLSAIAYRMLLEAARSRLPDKLPAPVQKALDHMAANIGAMVSVEELAGLTGISTSQFYRQFELHVGAPPLRHFREMKINRAKDMLLHGNLSVKHIAYSLGYEDPLAFSTRFRKIVGSAPSDYRRKTQHDYR